MRGGASRWRSAWTKSRTPGSATRRMPSGAGPTPPSSASSLTRTRTRTRTPCWCSTPRTRRPKPRWRRRRTGRSRGRRRGRRGAWPGAEAVSASPSRTRTSEDFADARMRELVDAGSTRTTGIGRAPGRARGGWAREASFRGDLAELLKTPLGVKAERRATRGERAVSLAGRRAPARRARASAREERHARVARRARDGGTKAASAVDMLRATRARASARRREAPPGKNEGGARRPWRHPVTFFFNRDAACERRAPLPEGYRLLF